MARIALFDFDGTLVDSDEALKAPFRALGVDPERVPLGLPAAAACELVGVSLDDYVAHYDAEVVRPFPGVAKLLASLPRWGLCSNKISDSGRKELARLGWAPAAALFSEDFGGREKALGPLLEALGLGVDDAVYVGDTRHDRAAAAAAGVRFALAGWNPRARASAEPSDLVLDLPGDVVGLLAEN